MTQPQPFDPNTQPDPATLQAVQALTAQIAAGPKPEWIFLCGTPQSLLTFNGGLPDQKPSMLLFLSPFAAMDYLEATKAPGHQVRQVKFEQVSKMAEAWLASGQLGGFILNRCPRCSMCFVCALQSATQPETLFKLWAARRATQIVKGRQLVQLHMSAKDDATRIAALEQIRDHIDCGVPYIFELLAFYGHFTKNEAVKAAALEQLKKFGPRFADWDARWQGVGESFSRNAVEALLGLGQAFGIQPKTLP